MNDTKTNILRGNNMEPTQAVTILFLRKNITTNTTINPTILTHTILTHKIRTTMEPLCPTTLPTNTDNIMTKTIMYPS